MFPTPENEEFYASQPYSRLSHDNKTIRLLKVFPDDGTGRIKCSLLPAVQLDQVAGKYSALSYCAGDPNNRDTILVNGIKFNAFANLRHALGEVRDFWRKTGNDANEDLILWTDQICIDQFNMSERSHQVGFMKDIYQQAAQVLVCLSTSKGNPRGMEWLLQLTSEVPPYHDDLDLKSNKQTSTCDSDDDDWDLEPESDHFDRLVTHIRYRMGDEKFIRGWLAFYDVVESPWWSRAWIVQEFIVASRLHFLYRRRFGSWDNIAPILKSFCCVHDDLLTNRDVLLRYNEDKEYVLNGLKDRNVCRILQRIERGNSQAAIETILFLVIQKLTWNGTMDLVSLLSHARYCSTSDLRDRVYAFLGLGDPNYQIIPDYSQSLEQVLIHTTRRIIEFQDSLQILALAVASPKRPGSTLPSWVVDWTEKELGNMRDDHLSIDEFSLSKTQADASFTTTTNSYHVGGCVSLAVWGSFLGTLDIYVPDSTCIPQESRFFRSFQTAEGLHVLCSSAARVHDQVWVLTGSQCPLILRRAGKIYRLISSVHLMPQLELPLAETMAALIQQAEYLQGGRQRIMIV